MIIVSAVRDFTLYDKLIRNNPFCARAELVPFDNRVENLSITTRYNSFLDNYDYSKESWFVFCHEDWELKEDLANRLEHLDRGCLYGPIGCVLNDDIIFSLTKTKGRISHSAKDGSD